MPTQWSEAEQVPLGCIAPPTPLCSSVGADDPVRPNTASAVSFRASAHTGVGIRSPVFASGGLFSFSSERKEEKKRRQKLRFWISLRAFAHRLSC